MDISLRLSFNPSIVLLLSGETANSVEPPERKCCTQEYGNLCNEKTCLACNSIREANSQTVRGTLLVRICM